MSNFIFGSHFIQEAMQASLWFVLVSLAVAAHTAQSEEGLFALDKDISTPRLVSLDAHWQLSYRLNTNLNTNAALNRSKDAAPTATAFNSTPRLLLATEPKNEDNWSIGVQKQIPSSSDCRLLSSVLCLDAKEQQSDVKPLRDSFWVVWRKALHF